MNERNESVVDHFLICFLAELLLENRRRIGQKAHHHICSTKDRDWRRANLRLQVPLRRCQDSLQMQCQKVQKVHELIYP